MAIDLQRNNRSKAAPQPERQAVRLQVANVPARNCRTTGVQDTPKSFSGSFMRNVETRLLRPSGQANRKASCWRAGLRCLKKAKAFAVMARDTGCDIPGSARRLIFGRCLSTRKQNESVLERNANDDTVYSIGAPFGFGHTDSLLLSCKQTLFAGITISETFRGA